eukprot:GHVP01026001.1.p1 GENE.GHVP01026001.1~~GHVP01026001.1.p1  ORF type:complete len:121 (+),score=4.70 GHVP01026001.1:947-1309(+)
MDSLIHTLKNSAITRTTWRHVFGVLNVYRRIIPAFASLTTSIANHLPEQAPIQPTDQDYQELEHLKAILPNCKLRLPTTLHSATIISDYSPHALAAIIFDDEDTTHPISCLSEKLSNSKQ